jgi:aldehyde dehydrogenase (NAD+)
MKQALQFYANGAWVDPIGRETLDVINPATEEAYARIALGTQADVDRAVAAAKQAFPAFSRTSRKERVQLLESVIAVYKKRYEEMAEAISDEMGARFLPKRPSGGRSWSPVAGSRGAEDLRV